MLSFQLQLSQIKLLMVNGQYISSSRAHCAKKTLFVTFVYMCISFICTLHSRQRFMQRLAKSLKLIDFLWSFPNISWECCLQISSEFWLKQQRFHLVKATLNQEVYYCFVQNLIVLWKCVYQNVSRSFRLNLVVGDNMLNWMSICQRVEKDRNISFGPL